MAREASPARMGDTSGLRRKDTTKGPALRILSLDGGGVRGYSMLIILQELMHRTFVEIHGRAPKRDEIPKPCDHFDLIGGTGTGGLIALMLGRLRLDIETCKDTYVRMTRRVFQTDKTIAGIPYKSTLFKASKLEEVIRECVREHTVFDNEGNDILSSATPMTPEVASLSSGIGSPGMPHRSMSQSSQYSQVGRSPTTSARVSLNFGALRFGNSNALLYDTRENRTKTAVTAVFKGTRGAESTVLLRSYDSRKEPAPDVNCTIWQAGRATSATGLAFKPIQIGQCVYHDDGSGKFNPAPLMLDEAVQNEYPGRDVGVFVSIGTGKRPSEHSNGAPPQEWWEGFMGGSLGDFAEARRRLIAKIEGCEDTHQFMLHQHLAARGVNADNYYRFNVEVGVGEFAMNEWNRLGDISVNTRMYLSKDKSQAMNVNAASKLAKVHLTQQRQARDAARRQLDGDHQPSTQPSWNPRWDGMAPQTAAPLPMAVELPGDDSFPGAQNGRPLLSSYQQRPSVVDQKYTIIPEDGLEVAPQQVSAPPLPPKAPLPYPDWQAPVRPQAHQNLTSTPISATNTHYLPYPDVDGPPPAVNTANKPHFRR